MPDILKLLVNTIGVDPPFVLAVRLHKMAGLRVLGGARNAFDDNIGTIDRDVLDIDPVIVEDPLGDNVSLFQGVLDILWQSAGHARAPDPKVSKWLG